MKSACWLAGTPVERRVFLSGPRAPSYDETHREIGVRLWLPESYVFVELVGGLFRTMLFVSNFRRFPRTPMLQSPRDASYKLLRPRPRLVTAVA